MKGICFIEELFHKIPTGQKTMTRRIMKPQPDSRGVRTTNVMFEDWHGREIKPNYKIGDIVFMKEPYAYIDDFYVTGKKQIAYKFKGNTIIDNEKGFWKNKLFMPSAAARYCIKITDIRVERIQDISEKDAKAEGMGESSVMQKICYRPSFVATWCKIHRNKSWQENPWVFVYTFKFLPNYKP